MTELKQKATPHAISKAVLLCDFSLHIPIEDMDHQVVQAISIVIELVGVKEYEACTKACLW
jgi:hypothetical protein